MVLGDVLDLVFPLFCNKDQNFEIEGDLELWFFVGIKWPNHDNVVALEDAGPGRENLGGP